MPCASPASGLARGSHGAIHPQLVRAPQRRPVVGSRLGSSGRRRSRREARIASPLSVAPEGFEDRHGFGPSSTPPPDPDARPRSRRPAPPRPRCRASASPGSSSAPCCCPVTVTKPKLRIEAPLAGRRARSRDHEPAPCRRQRVGEPDDARADDGEVEPPQLSAVTAYARPASGRGSPA